MIPKKIHYCWFGRGDKGTLFEKCLKSWKKYFPDYEIVEWNEDNFDINCNIYISEAYKMKKYAFVSDYARLKIIYDNGGIYFDTDVEVLKRIPDKILEDGYLSEEESGIINTGLGFSAKPKDKIIKKMMDDYNKIHFISSSNEMDLTPCPVRNTKSLEEAKYTIKAFEKVGDLTVYPPDYFCGFDVKNNCVNITQNTYTLHHYNGSWMTKKDRTIARIRRIISRIVGRKNYEKIRRFKRKALGDDNKNEKSRNSNIS